LTDVTASVAAVIVAAGSGRRFGGEGPPKQYRELLGAPLLAWTLRPFLRHPGIGRTVLVLPAADVDDAPAWLLELPVIRVAGGAERGDSVRNGLAALGDEVRTVLVHDGARPLVSENLISRLIDASREGAVIPGLPVTDTLKEVDDGGRVVRTVDRSRFSRVQTPQAFPRADLVEVHRRAHEAGIAATDDAALFERYGLQVRVVEGESSNLKVTTPEDLVLARLLARDVPDRP
jgi:2-C-methyl-D-erythritol 4-phosphate cytidylyltransferase